MREIGEVVTLPISGIVPTAGRPGVLARTLQSLRAQFVLPTELIIVDASCDKSTRAVASAFAAEVEAEGCRVLWEPAMLGGAAAQRNQGVALAQQPVICFFDDDIIFGQDCIARLWRALQSDPSLGGVNAMITNQLYRPPRVLSRWMFRLMAGRAQASYAGRVLGPAVNLLPEDRDDLPDVVPVEWLNLGCTLYRYKALPDPVFGGCFTGYSLMEDLALSLAVGRNWKLANVRSARIYHDSRPGAHKDEPVARSRMELVNRHHVMTEVLQRRSRADYARLALWECFQLAVCAIQRRADLTFWRVLRGKLLGLRDILMGRPERAAE
jgi:cellulose synthase/poly-beta-1,6-N-acetylglucosamine synthase-like glycosyltransferase